MNVLLVEPNTDPRAIEINGSLAAMQSLVGGLIQAIYPFKDPVALICNDEGKLAGLPQNRPLKHPETGEIYDIVCGTFFLCSAPSGSENFESLPDNLIEKYSKVFALPSLVCTSCGNKFYREQLSPFDGELLCPSCLSNQTVYCSCCDRRIWIDDNVGTDAQPLCQDCFDDHFERCTTCNALIRRVDTFFRGDDPSTTTITNPLPFSAATTIASSALSLRSTVPVKIVTTLPRFCTSPMLNSRWPTASTTAALMRGSRSSPTR